MADLPHGFSQVDDPLDVYATFIAEACIETVDDSVEDKEDHLPD